MTVDTSSAQSFASRLNWLRAGVLGANDGIVSIAALVVGVAAATNNRDAILIAGAISMALGEYVSVSSQRDSERAVIDREAHLLATEPERELRLLQQAYQERGLSEATANTVAKELTEHDAITAHLQVEMNIDGQTTTNPWHAALSSFVAFVLGAALPLLAVTIVTADYRIGATVVGSLVALALTGGVGAKLGGAKPIPAIARVMLGGAGALAITWTIGELLGTSLAL